MDRYFTAGRWTADVEIYEVPTFMDNDDVECWFNQQEPYLCSPNALWSVNVHFYVTDAPPDAAPDGYIEGSIARDFMNDDGFRSYGRWYSDNDVDFAFECEWRKVAVKREELSDETFIQVPHNVTDEELETLLKSATTDTIELNEDEYDPDFDEGLAVKLIDYLLALADSHPKRH